MSIFFIIAIVLQRQRSINHIIAAAALLLLVYKPLALFTVSFQLSFSSVLAIAVIYPQLLQLLEQKDPATVHKAVTYTCTALFVSIAATLGSLPFMLLHFNRISPVGPLMNLFVEPLLCLWSLPIGLVAMPLVFLSPDLAALILQIGSLGISAAVKITSLGSTLPFASLWTITPTNLEILVYYAILLLWYFHAEFPKGKQIALLLSTIFILVFSRGLWLNLSSKNTQISFLDIGQGSSTVIQMPEGKTALLDGGNTSSPSFDPGKRVIAPFLWKKQIWRLDDMIISHPHSDHFNGLLFILHQFKPKRLWVNTFENDSLPYRELLQEAEKNGIKILTPASNSLLISDGKAKLTALNRDYPETVSDFSVNDLSLILKLQHENFSFLFPGDISKKMEKVLVDNGAELQADVLLSPHHASRGSGSVPFISAVNPKIIVISAGKDRRGRYLDSEHLKTWRNEGRTVLVTSRNGTISCTTDGKDIQISTYKRN
jgi:competence protein ComEC